MPTSKYPKASITVGELSQRLGVEFEGDAHLSICSVSSFSSATPSDLCFLKSARYIEQLKQSACAAVIVPLDFKESMAGKTVLYSANPHLTFVDVINLLQLYKGNWLPDSIHPSASIAASANLGKNISIGAHCVIGDRVTLGDGVQVGAGCVIENDVSIGANSLLLANVTVCYQVIIGERAILQPGVVIGGDGFGLVYHAGSWVKIPHLGTVIIADQVEIGANTTIDRGALDDTVIEKGVKLDNLIQIGHNVRIGEHTAIAACVAIAGSTVIGKNCKISGAVAIAGHLSVADNVTITGMSTVTKSIKSSGTYSSGTPLMENRLWHRSNVRYKNLDKMAKTLSDLENKEKNHE